MRLVLCLCSSAIVACGGGFDVGGGGGGATSASTGATSQATSGVTTSASTNASASISASASASASDAASVSASASASASSSTGMVICDADGDGFEIDASGCCTTALPCDCDDADSDVFPGQTAFFTEPRPSANTPTLAFDYDCDGASTPQYPFDAAGCSLLCQSTETTFEASEPDEACGTTVTLQTCVVLMCQQTLEKLACR